MKFIKDFKQYTYGIILSIGIVFLGSSCNDPTLVGTSLFADDNINIVFTDTIAVVAENVKGDSAVYSNTNVYLVGGEDNPSFGSREAGLYFNIYRGSSTPEDFASVEIDSVIMSINYDTLGIDESKLEEMAFELYQLDEEFPDVATTNDVLTINPLMINENHTPTVALPQPRDSINIKSYTDLDSTLRVRPQLRIPLDESFYTTLINNDIVADDDDSTFVALTNGFLLASTDKSIAAFNMSSSNFITVYYTKNDTTKLLHTYYLGSKIFNHFEHDYSGSEMEVYLNNSSGSDDLLFVEGMAGTNIEIDVSNIENHKGKLLNYAELEFFVDENSQEDQILADNIIGLYKNDSTVLYTLDATYGITNSLLQELHDGYLKTDEIDGRNHYRLIVTAQLSEFLQSDGGEKTFVISVLNKSSTTYRSTIYGTNHPDYPMRLRTVFTEPK